MLTLRGQGRRRGVLMSQLGVLRDGALLIQNGKVLEAGPSRRVENLVAARRALEINAAGRVVMPGFVDSHTHTLIPPPGEGDSESTLRAVRASTAQSLAGRARKWLLAMARHGTTTVEAKTGCGRDEGAETKLLRVLGALHGSPLDVVASHQLRLEGAEAGQSAEFAITKSLPGIRKRRHARYLDLYCDDAPGQQELLRRCAAAATELQIPYKIHGSAGTIAEVVRSGVGRSAASVDHWEHATAADAELFARTGTMATVLPGAWHEQAGRAPVRALLDGGAPVALASDFSPEGERPFSMAAVVAMAARYLGFTLEEAICAATVNGAYALGYGDTLGALEPGRAADLLILNASDYRDLARYFGVNLVHLTMKGGAFIYQEGKVGPLPPEGIHSAWQ